MKCPHCGSNSPVVQARCTSCGRPVAAARPAATAVLTPPPQTPPGDLPTINGDLTLSESGVTGLPPTLADFGADFDTPVPPQADDITHTPDASRPSPSAGPLLIGQRFGPRYRIVKLLGIGGMGAVYQAWDSELEVVVALKVIRPEAGADPREVAAIERRFKQELLLARQVTHKNVVRIHDLGEIGGIKYITMSFIQGDDLATVLQREGTLVVPAALQITRQIASGLLAAHEAGVVHRDLKPANIMIEGDHAIIMDFGIARSSAGAPPVPAEALPISVPRPRNVAQTVAGSVVGTITYMAPEQAQGLPVDQRADMYSLGLIVADMLLGLRRRGTDVSAMDDLQRRMTEAPLPLRSVDPKIPEAFDRIILRLLEPDPRARFQTTAELVAALDRLDDNGVPLPLIRRLTPRLMAAIGVIVTALLAGTFFVTRQALAPPVVHDPISVVIADFQNNTNDTQFDRVLEPTLRRGLEGASFITALDRNRLAGYVGVRPPERLDEQAAREIAVKQGLNVIVAGSIDPQGSGYNVAVKVVQAVTGNVLATANRRATNNEDVLAAATRLAATVRTALGDETRESDQMFAMTSLSATSLDVVRLYVEGQEASSNNRQEEARQKFAAALEKDPKFGIAYTSLAAALRNLGRPQEAEKYLNESLRYLDGMTERERLSTRGYFYLAAGDYQLCVKEYGDLISRFSADIVGRNQRALCMTRLRDMRGAVDEMRYVVNLLPNRTIFRTNLALYANYAGDFPLAKQEAESLPPSEHSLLALAMSQLGQGQRPEAIATYEKLVPVSALGASFAASGLADAAVVEGRFSDAVRILEQGAARDLAEKKPEAAAAKFAAIANAELARGRKPTAMVAAEKAIANSKSVKIRFLAAKTFVEAGDIKRARPLIDGLAAELQAAPQAHAQILEGQIALLNGDPRQAIKALTAANSTLDTWIGHFFLGRAYLEASQFVQADSEFDRCIKRRGEALSLFVDEDPSFGYFPVVYYYQGRVREGLKNAGSTESYKGYLAFRGESKEDPLLADIRKRIGS
jgi:serine/threonine protein kinase/tetratricopeptide (TPR) repeat protein